MISVTDMNGSKYIVVRYSTPDGTALTRHHDGMSSRFQERSRTTVAPHRRLGLYEFLQVSRQWWRFPAGE